MVATSKNTRYQNRFFFNSLLDNYNHVIVIISRYTIVAFLLLIYIKLPNTKFLIHISVRFSLFPTEKNLLQ